MDGLHDADVSQDDLGAVNNWLLVATWVVYPDVVLSCSCFGYAVLFQFSLWDAAKYSFSYAKKF